LPVDPPLPSVLEQTTTASGLPSRPVDGLANTVPQGTAACRLPILPPDLKVQLQTWGRYKLLEFLGSGGMGSVYQAQDLRLNRTVALKFLRPDLLDAGSSQRRFEAEARAQARIEHPHICKLYDFGVVQGQPYIAMQFIVGASLEQMRSVMTRKQQLRAMKDIAEALHAAHLQGVVHRDVKPANILIERREDGTYWPYLVDFGLARQVDVRTQSSVIGAAGTPGYMSPEQGRGELQVSHRTDVYGLGATLYSLLCGRPPFCGNPAQVLLDVLSKEPQRMRTFDKSIPVDLDTLVLKCLEKEPALRYGTAKAVAEDLERCLLGSPITASPPSLLQRLLRLTRAHKLLVASLSIALVAVLLIGGVVLRARIQSAEQARLAQHLGEEIAKMEWLLRSARQIPLHNLSREKAIIRQRIQALQTELAGSGRTGRGLTHYALGRGHLALREYPQALAQLQLAVQQGNQSAEVHYAIGLTLGKHFEQALHEARLSGGGAWAQRQLRELEPRYLTPAISSLQRSQAAQLEVPEYLEALLAFYKRDYDEALTHTAGVLDAAPWMYEAAKLAGDIHHEKAMQARDRGSYDQAQQEFTAAVHSYECAAATGQSDAEVYAALAETWLRQLEMQGARSRPIEEAYAAAVAASDKAALAEPQSTAGLLKKAFATMMALSISGPGPAVSERIKLCLEATEKVLQQEPSSPYAREAAAGCYAMAAAQALSQGQDPEPLWSKALDVFEVVIQQTPRFVWGLNDLGNIYGLRGAYRAQRGNLAARADLERSLHYYQSATALDENYLVGWQNLLGCLDEIVLLSSKQEQEQSLVPMAEQVFGKCLAINNQYQQCYSNYAIFYVRLAKVRSAAGEEPMPYLTRAREKFADLQRLGGSYLDAERHQALLHYLDASERLRRRSDPAAAQAELRAALARCLMLDGQDATCLTLATQAEWVEADWLVLKNQSAMPVLKRALEKALLATQSPVSDPDSWWTLAQTHLRAARVPLSRPTLRDQHLEEGLAAADRVLVLNPHHEPGRQTKREIQQLLAAGRVLPGVGRPAQPRWSPSSGMSFHTPSPEL